MLNNDKKGKNAVTGRSRKRGTSLGWMESVTEIAMILFLVILFPIGLVYVCCQCMVEGTVTMRLILGLGIFLDGRDLMKRYLDVFYAVFWRCGFDYLQEAALLVYQAFGLSPDKV